MADEDFQEGEVWYSIKNREDPREKDQDNYAPSPSKKKSSPSKTNSSANARVAKSAPIKIPGRSKAHRSNDDDDDDDDEQMPPHEWVAKKLARSKISSSSVCEGAGRTLKGRDQTKVRNDVLTKTGFLEE